MATTRLPVLFVMCLHRTFCQFGYDPYNSYDASDIYHRHVKR